MNTDVGMQAAMRQYLLGEIDENRRDTLEERLMLDESFNDELSAAEDDLIDAYLADELTDAERDSFKRSFLSTPERRRKLTFARTFRRYVSNARHAETDTAKERDVPPVPRPTPFSLAWLMQHRALGASLAALLLLAVAFGAYRAFVSRSGTGGERAALEREIAELNSAGRDVARAPSINVTLSPGLVRSSDGVQIVNLTAGIAVVKLQLLITASEYESYRAALESEKGEEVFTLGGLKDANENGVRVVPLNIPAHALESGVFRLKLS